MRSYFKMETIRSRILQAPMAGVTTAEMAAAVSNSGAIGSIGVGGLGLDDAVAFIKRTKKLTDRPFNINLFCHDPTVILDSAKDIHWRKRLNTLFFSGDEILNHPLRNIYQSIQNNMPLAEAIAAQAPQIISFHFGVPDPKIISVFRKTGAKLMATATNIKEAEYIMRSGLDAIIAQGIEAGGHRGLFNPTEFDEGLSTYALTRQLAKHMSIPIIAAGGIMTGQDIAFMLQLGASGVQLGSAFLGCTESAASQNHKNLIRSKKPFFTILTRVISGRPARSIMTPFTQWGLDIGDNEIPDYPYAYDAFKQIQKNQSVKKNNNIGEINDIGPFWAGQGASFARFISASTIIEQLEREYKQAIYS